jgi:seryl-tRNA synthetase
VHDPKDIRKNPDKYRESQRKRGLSSDTIDVFLLDDAELRALKTIQQELQSKLNKLTELYGKAKREGVSQSQLVWIELEMEMAKLDAVVASSDVRIEFIERREWAMIDMAFGGRENYEKICEEIDAQEARKKDDNSEAQPKTSPDGISENRSS